MTDLSIEPTKAQLWLVMGRVYGDDDDSYGLIWAKDEEQAKAMFTSSTLDLSEAVLAQHSDQVPQYFITHTLLLGSGNVRQFQLAPGAVQEMLCAPVLSSGPSS